MVWLTQNWIWIAIAVGGFFLMSRMHGSGHSHGGGNDHPQADRGVGSVAAFDPVSQRSVPTSDAAISTVYRGRAYYFESRENREAFEGNPEKYLAGSPAAGQAIGAEAASTDRTHRRHGC